MIKDELIKKVKKFSDEPGVYLMRGERREILYIGKATSLRQRVISYFQRPQEARIEKMLSQVTAIDTHQTDSVLEALLLENNLIKKHQPKYNVKLKDSKTYLGIYITREDWPRVFPARVTQKLPAGDFYGPFPSSKQVGAALQIIRKLFPFRVSCEPLSGKACFEYHLGMCPGVCAGKLSQKEYQNSIRQIRLLFAGRKKDVVKNLEKEMKLEAKALDYERAAKIRDQIFALKHIQDVALINEDDINTLPDIPSRIEAYDIANIGGAFNVGSMVVFTEGLIDKNQYRKFKIKTVDGANDVASMAEVITRRLNHDEWPMPDLILVDGGLGQVNAAKKALREKNMSIPVIGLAKGPDRKKNELINGNGLEIDPKILVKIRDEAHRFANEYYKTLHQKTLAIK